MPTVRKLTSDEVDALQTKAKGRRKLLEEQYDAILSDYDVGDYGEAELSPEENRLTERNRLRAAALRRGMMIEFQRTSGDFLRFHIREHSASNAASAAPSTNRKGRKKRAG
jgi:hypothetical protein